MNKLILKSVILCCLFLGSQTKVNAQIFEHPEKNPNGVESGIFQNEEIFRHKSSFGKRSSGGATYDNNMTFGGNIPIDGGLSVFVTAIIGYGINRLKKRKHQKTDV
jgi:hypothetical protein